MIVVTRLMMTTASAITTMPAPSSHLQHMLLWLRGMLPVPLWLHIRAPRTKRRPHTGRALHQPAAAAAACMLVREGQGFIGGKGGGEALRVALVSEDDVT